MKDLDKKKTQLTNARSERANRRRAVSLMGALVIVATAIALMAPAISMTRGELVCGIEEHQHSDACYEQVLVCGYGDAADGADAGATVVEPAAAAEGHVHTDACYDRRLVCQMPEHTHSSACYAEAGAPADDGAEMGVQDDQSATDAQGSSEGVAVTAEGEDVAGTTEDGQLAEAAGADASEGAGDAMADTQLEASSTEDAANLDAGEALDADPSENADSAEPEEPADDDAAAGVGEAADGELAGSEAVEAPMPEQDVVAEADLGDGTVLRVHAKCDAGILPEGTTMQLSGLAEEKADGVIELVKHEAEAQVGISADECGIVATDVRFLDAEGSVVEPLGPVTMWISHPAIEEQASFAVLNVVYAEDKKTLEGQDADAAIDAQGEAQSEASDVEAGSEGQDADAAVDEQGADPTIETQADAQGTDPSAEASEEPKDEALVIEPAASDLSKHVVRLEPAAPGTYALAFMPPADDAAAAQDGESAEGADGAEDALATTGLVVGEPAAMPAAHFTQKIEAADGSTVTVAVDADEGTFPEGVTMQAALVDDDEVIDAAKAEAADELGAKPKNTRALAVDITFFDAEGNPIEPAKDVRVSMRAREIANQDQLAVVHVDDEANAQLVDSGNFSTKGSKVSFDAAEFSVYAVVYTVDFHWDVDGETYDFSIQGGDAISLKELLVILHTVKSDEAQDFVDDIKAVEFSNPELIHVAKVEEDTTAGAIKDKYKLEPEYSAELTPEEIAEFDAKEFKAIDWVLTTLKAFATEETLVITMADGEVFTIKVTDACEDPLGLDGRTFAIVNQRSGNSNSGNGRWYALSTDIGDKASHTGWRGNYIYSHDVTDSYSIDQATGREYCWERAAAWRFEYNAAEKAYYVSANGKYLYIDPSKTTKESTTDNSLTLVADKNQADKGTLIKITTDDNGNYRFSGYNSDSLTLWDYGKQGTNNGMFWLDNGTDVANGNMRLCLPEATTTNYDGQETPHKASLTSVQNLQPRQSVVIYQRVRYYNADDPDDDKNNTYTYYALSDDPTKASGVGTVKLWNSSDAVYWRGNPAILWTFMEATDADGNPNGYYYFKNEATGRYLAAKADGTLVQTLNEGSDKFTDDSKVVKHADHVQVALPGIRTGSYASKIANWDYDMSVTSGPKVNDDGDALPESVTSEDLAASQEFFFAVRDPIIQQQFTEVDTVDSESKGVHMTMYDFSQWGWNQWGHFEHTGNRLPYMTSVIGSDGWAPGVYTPGLVSDTLPRNADGTYGWPTTSAERSLGDIFVSHSDVEYTVTSKPANHLFLQSVYDSTGYFRYSSFENSAEFNTETGDFAVYEQLGVPAVSQAVDGSDHWNAYYTKRGNFMPYNTPTLTDPRDNLTRPEDSQQLDDEDPRKGEDVYRYTDRNYFFGMILDAKFQQDYNGVNGRGDPVRYDFNGDDDMWVYIDGVLILDLGGVHDAFAGHIDFTTGRIWVDNDNNPDTNESYIKDRFWAAGVFPDGTPWDNTNPANYDSDQASLYFKGKTFADYSSHDFRMYYMERGAGASNLEMQFNLTTLTEDQFRVTKEMPETETGHNVQAEYGNAAFYYRAYKEITEYNGQTNKNETRVVPIKKTDLAPGNSGATYETAARDVQYIRNDAGEIVNTIESDLTWQTDEIFELRPGHSAVFPVTNHGVRYYVEEVEPESGATMLENFYVYNSDPETDSAQITDKTNRSETPYTQADDKQILSATKTVQQRSEVIYRNKPDDGLINELRITKKLHGKMLTDGQGNPLLSNVGSPYFEYAIYLENNDGKMVPYSLGAYYIIDKYGRFVYYTKTDSVRHYYGFEKNTDGTYSYYNVTPSKEGEAGWDAEPTWGSLIETTTNPKITEHAGEEGYLGDIRDGDTLVIVGLLEGTHFIVDEICYGDDDFLTLDGSNAAYLAGGKYLFDYIGVKENVHVSGENVPEDEHATGHLFNKPDTTGISVSAKAAEGDIRLDCDTEATVHNRTVTPNMPIIVKKNWSGIAADDAALANTKVKVTLGRYVLKDKAGALTIKKTGVPAGAAFYAVYTVKDSNGRVVANIPYNVAVASEAGRTIYVTPGTYTVTETIYSQGGDYTWNHNPSNAPESANPASITTSAIADEGSDTVTFTCSPVLKTGNLKVTSSYTIPSGGTVDFSNVTYTVYEGDENSTTRAKFPNGELVPVIAFFAQANADGGYTVEGLKVGKYTVKENGVPITSSDGGYTLTDHTPAWQWHVTKTIADGATETATFASVYTRADTNINYMIGKPSAWGSSERITGTNSDFAVGETVKLTFYSNKDWDQIANVIGVQDNGEALTANTVVAYGGESVSYTRTAEGNNSKYEITFTVKENADLKVFINANPNDGNQFWGMNWEKVSRSALANTAPLRSAVMKAAAVLLGAVGNADDNDGVEDPEITREAAAASINYGNPPTPTNENQKYVDDVNFTMDDSDNPGTQVPYAVTLTQSGNWTWSSIVANANLPEADQNGNKYYYYIKSVEEEGAPAATTTTVKLDGENTFLVGKDKHFNTSTNTPDPLEVNNVVKGSLKVTKNVKVNDHDVMADTKQLFNQLADGTYTFTIAGVANTPTANETRTITVEISDGVSNTVEVDNLTPGQYTVTEVVPPNGTVLVGNNNLTATVQAGKIGGDVPAAAMVAFTNNIDTTQLAVQKVWADDGQEGVDHSGQTITYKIHRIPYAMVDDPDNPGQKKRVEYTTEEVTAQNTQSLSGYTGTLRFDSQNAAQSWKESVEGLPKTGTVQDAGSTVQVAYEYYVTEETAIEGYKSLISGGEITDGEHQGEYSYTITNEPMSPTDQETQIDVKKEWKNADGTADTDLHKNDSVVFTVTQKKYEAKAKYTYGGVTYEKALYPITIDLVDKKNDDGTSSTNRVHHKSVVYVPEGASFTMTPHYDDTENANQHVVAGGGFDTIESSRDPERWGYGSGAPSNLYYYPGATFKINEVNSARDVVLWIYDGNDQWISLYDEIDGPPSSVPSPLPHYKWTCEMASPQGIIWDLNEMLDKVTKGTADTTIDPSQATAPEPAATSTPQYTMSLTKNDTGLPTIFTRGENAPGYSDGDDEVTWKGEITHLPLYEYKGAENKAYVYTYEVTEAAIGSDAVSTANPPEGWKGESSAYLVNWDKNEQTGLWTVTNQKKPSINVSIHKVAKENVEAGTPLLPGAKFKLVKYTKITPSKDKDLTWGTNGESAEVSEDPQNPGVFSFSDLDVGYYEIVETKYPDGYMKATENPIFKVQTNSQTHAMEAVLVYPSGEHVGEPISGNKTDMVKIDNATIIVGNEPGIALPVTGGIGVEPLMLLGGALVALAMAVLTLGRRRRER